MRNKFLVCLLALLSACNHSSQVPHHLLEFAKLNTTIDLYYLECGYHPESLEELDNPTLACEKWVESNDAKVKLIDYWGRKYIYAHPSKHKNEYYPFDLYSLGEDGVEGTSDDITNWRNIKIWRQYK